MSHSLVSVDTWENGLSIEAHDWLSGLQRVPGERDKKKPRLKFIRGLIIKKRFNRCDWGVCRCLEDLIDYRVNGQHTRDVLQDLRDGKLEPDATFDGVVGVPVTIHRYECETKADLADVFDQFDQHKSTRSADDKLGIYMAQHEDLVGIDKKLCSSVLAGVDCCRKYKQLTHVQELLVEVSGDIEEAYDRGKYLYLEVVRDFIGFLKEFDDAPFTIWREKSGITARMFSLYVQDKETAELLIEQMLFEAGDIASEFTKKVRADSARTGKDQGYFFRTADRYIKRMMKDVRNLGREAIKEMIREVAAEQAEEAPDEEPVAV